VIRMVLEGFVAHCRRNADGIRVRVRGIDVKTSPTLF
jgi:hypothetical protein